MGASRPKRLTVLVLSKVINECAVSRWGRIVLIGAMINIQLFPVANEETQERAWSPDRPIARPHRARANSDPISPPHPSVLLRLDLDSIPTTRPYTPPSTGMFTQTIDPQLRFRQAVQSPTASLSYIQRLSLKLQDLRNTDPATRQTSLALAALAGRTDVCLWLIEEGHDEEEISAVSLGEN